MPRSILLLLVASVLGFCSPLLAQSVSLVLEPPSAERTYEVDALSETAVESKMTVDGQEMPGGGGGGRGGAGPAPAGPVTRSQRIVFVEAPKGQAWRKYSVLEGTTSGGGADGGSPVTVTGGLQGKKILFDRASGAVVFRDEKADGPVFDDRLTSGVPTTLELAGLLPGRSVDVGSSFEVGDGFQTALRSLLHPIRADVRAETPEPAPAEPSEDSRGGRGGRRLRPGGGPPGRRGFSDTALRMLTNPDLTCRLTGRLESVTKVGNKELAVIELVGTISGQGDPAELGMSAGGMPGGGRRGGADAAAAPSGSASVDLGIEARVVVDVATKTLEELLVRGALKSAMETTRSMSRGEQTRELTMSMRTDGSFVIAVCAH